MRARRGNAAYTVLCSLVLLGFTALTVDVGHVRSVQAELAVASDAAATAAVSAIDGTPEGLVAARDRAVAYAAANLADRAPVVVDRNDGNAPSGDVVLGVWDETSATFTPSTDPAVVNAARVFAARDDVDTWFGLAAFGTEALAASASTISVLGDTTGAGQTACFLPFALPTCVFDGATDGELNLTDLQLQPATGDNVGWGSPFGTPTPPEIEAQVSGQCAAGEVALGDPLYLGNGTDTSALTYVADAIAASATAWQADAWGTQPAQLASSAVPADAYGRTLEGPILLFDGGPDYCDADPASGAWNGNVTIAGFAWGAVYDVRATGPAAERNVRMRLELLDDYDFGTGGGGPDHGIVYEEPPVIVR